MAKKRSLRCIFCLGYRLSHEHVIPDWIRKIIPKKPHHGSRLRVTSSGPSNVPPNRRPRLQRSRDRQGHPISKKVRVVCETCNTGWLSALEGELKPRIKALVLGEESILTQWDQRRLATWAAKTAMTAEFIHPESAAIAFEEREYLRLHREPPIAFNIWMAHYDGSQHTTALHQSCGRRGHLLWRPNRRVSGGFRLATGVRRSGGTGYAKWS